MAGESHSANFIFLCDNTQVRLQLFFIPCIIKSGAFENLEAQ